MLSRPETILTREAIDQHQLYLYERGLSSNTSRAYKSDLREYLTWRTETYPHNPPKTKAEEQDYMVSWLTWSGRNLSPATQRRRKAAVSSYCRFSRGYDIAFLDDVRLIPSDLRIPHPLPGLDSSLAKMVMRAWMDNNNQAAALVGMGGYIGCRVSESRSLTVLSFLLQSSEVEIVGKGNKKRRVPLGKNAWAAVQPVYDSAWSVYQKTGVAVPLITLSDRTAREQITALGRAIKLPRSVSSHDLRATFATVAYSLCKDPAVVMRLMGHADMKDTLRYIQEDETARREAVNF